MHLWFQEPSREGPRAASPTPTLQTLERTPHSQWWMRELLPFPSCFCPVKGPARGAVARAERRTLEGKRQRQQPRKGRPGPTPRLPNQTQTSDCTVGGLHPGPPWSHSQIWPPPGRRFLASAPWSSPAPHGLDFLLLGLTLPRGHPQPHQRSLQSPTPIPSIPYSYPGHPQWGSTCIPTQGSSCPSHLRRLLFIFYILFKCRLLAKLLENQY